MRKSNWNRQALREALVSLDLNCRNRRNCERAIGTCALRRDQSSIASLAVGTEEIAKEQLELKPAALTCGTEERYQGVGTEEIAKEQLELLQRSPLPEGRLGDVGTEEIAKEQLEQQ